jgi:alkyldihydroxyacetonephosphate synthase
VHFARFADGVLAARKIAQSGLFPSNCRLLDAGEAMMHEVSPKGATSSPGASVLLLGFESADHPVEPWMERALSIATDLGGDCAVEPTYTTSFSSQSNGETDAEQGAWRKAFFAAPYLQSALVTMGVMIDTFETAVTWDKFDALHAHVKDKVEAALKTHAGGGLLTSRFSHVYPDGPAPYFTFLGRPAPGNELAAWRAIKEVASTAVIEAGGTITHHHAVGREHRAHWEKERAPLIGAALSAVKAELDPAGIMNPGALLAAPK